MGRITFCTVSGLMVCLTAVWALRPDDPKQPPKEITNSLGMKLVLIPSGKFVMGMPKTKKIFYGNFRLAEVEQGTA